MPYTRNTKSGWLQGSTLSLPNPFALTVTQCENVQCVERVLLLWKIKCYDKNILPEKWFKPNFSSGLYTMYCISCKSSKERAYCTLRLSVFTSLYGVDEEWAVHMLNFCWSCSNCLWLYAILFISHNRPVIWVHTFISLASFSI